MSIIGFLIFGLVIGLIARAIFPGRQQMGWLFTAVLGMVGSLVGGLIGHALFGNRSAADGSWGFTPGGWLSPATPVRNTETRSLRGVAGAGTL